MLAEKPFFFVLNVFITVLYNSGSNKLTNIEQFEQLFRIIYPHDGDMHQIYKSCKVRHAEISAPAPHKPTSD